MIDPFSDELIALPDARKVLPNGVHEATLYLWWRHGINGVKLETIKVGRKRYTTRDALAQFCQQRALPSDHDRHVSRPSSNDAETVAASLTFRYRRGTLENFAKTTLVDHPMRPEVAAKLSSEVLNFLTSLGVRVL